MEGFSRNDRDRNRRLRIVVNPASGSDAPLLKIFNRVLGETTYDWDVAVTHTTGDARRLAREAVEAGSEIVAACGGDGTVMEVASGLLGTETLLAIVPGGTANVLAQELGIPSDTESACQLMVAEPRSLRRIDVGQAGEHYFLLRLGTGFDALMTAEADREMKERWGVLAYIISGLRVLQNPPLAHYRLLCDGVPFEADGYGCMVTNAAQVGALGMRFAPTIDMSDGRLDLFFLGESRLKTLTELATNLVANVPEDEALWHWAVREVSIEADPPQKLEADGELLGETPVYVRVLKQALTVIVPATV